MKYLFLLLSILTLHSCVGKIIDLQYTQSPKSKLVHEISEGVFKQLILEKNLYPCECGGRMMDQIKLLHWGFDYYHEIDIAEARELLITATNRLLQAINEDQRIRPYLATYPFKPENVEIRIFLHNSDGSILGPEKLHVIANIEGVLDYMIQASETRRLKKILIETFQEAEAKLNAPLPQAI